MVMTKVHACWVHGMAGGRMERAARAEGGGGAGRTEGLSGETAPGFFFNAAGAKNKILYTREVIAKLQISSAR